MRQIRRRYTYSAVFHIKADRPILRPGKTHLYRPSFRSELHRVGEKIVDDFLHHVAVERHQAVVRKISKSQPYTFLLRPGPERFQHTGHELGKIALTQLELLPSHLKFPEIKKVVDHVQQGFGIAVHSLQTAVFISPLLVFHKAFKRQDYQGKRCPKFM